MREETVATAMAIIMSAGDARLLCKQALDAIVTGDFATANELHKQSKKKIAEAHGLQTDAIQAEMSGGEPLEYNSLFTHAQDTLMTVYSEINIAKHLLHICSAYETRLGEMNARIEALEGK